MAREEIKAVIEAWKNGLSYANPGRTIHTDGETLYSYSHVIGETDRQGRKVVYRCRYSKTTTQHCALAAEYTEYVEPCEADHSKLLKQPMRR